ncbi:MAG: glutamate-5-semialdehyde dehydrogenase [Alphaproteobacteria bacterium]|jgi:glutamate-5-semialdehyde dehydrogenase
MSHPEKTPQQTNDNQTITDLMLMMGKQAKQAAIAIRTAKTDIKNQALLNAADYLEANSSLILDANKLDVDHATKKGLSDSMIDRLILNPEKVSAIATALRDIAALPDPVGRILAQWDRPNGLDISRIATPLGVIGIIYESRPNVTADAGALAMKSGNCCILRGGSESQHSSKAIHKCLVKGLESVNLPADIIQLVPTTDRAAVGMMLGEMTDYIDMIIPRGGKSLVARIQSEAKVPVLAHLEGICHSFVHKDADPQKALDIVVNAKMRRTGVCGATETVLIDKNFGSQDTINILSALSKAGCTVKGCDAICALYPDAILATEEDWKTEYLAPIVSVKIVDDLSSAIHHVQAYSSGHTEAIITENNEAADQFLLDIDSAIVIHNASTQFADGGEFGMGAEIGIATGKIHARGPVGLEQLTCFQYQIRGTGQIRPL